MPEPPARPSAPRAPAVGWRAAATSSGRPPPTSATVMSTARAAGAAAPTTAVSTPPEKRWRPCCPGGTPVVTPLVPPLFRAPPSLLATTEYQGQNGCFALSVEAFAAVGTDGVLEIVHRVPEGTRDIPLDTPSERCQAAYTILTSHSCPRAPSGTPWVPSPCWPWPLRSTASPGSPPTGVCVRSGWMSTPIRPGAASCPSFRRVRARCGPRRVTRAGAPSGPWSPSMPPPSGSRPV